MARKIIYILAAIVIMSAGAAVAQEMKGDRLDADDGTRAAMLPVTLFQKFISGIDGDRCPMYPSCSQYCAHAIKKHGALMGWIMACDRLMRCGRDEVKLSLPVSIHKHVLTYDSVENNDFWRK